MSTKKKLVISLTSLAIVLVVAVAAVGITLAALSGTVTSTFTITYKAYNVSATVSAKYKLGNAGEETNFEGGSEGSLTFQPETESATGSLTVSENIALDYDTKKFVVVTYTFKNNWTAQDDNRSNLLVALGDQKTTIDGVEGITITYSTDGSDTFDDADLSGLEAIAPDQTLTIKIKFELANSGTKSVNLSVNLNWVLTSQAIVV